ncbi:MAG: Tfp pilus assembly protein FimT/FimU [Planctomycetota bacterium]
MRMRTRHTGAGFTIIEMMVVMALIALMVGATFAMFRSMGKTNALESNSNEISSMIRRARSTALSRGSTVELGFELYREEGVVRSHLRRPVTHFHFEDAGSEAVMGTGGVRGVMTHATISSLGRNGSALQLFGEEASCVTVDADSRFDCTHGVSLSCDIFIERAANTTLIRRGTNYYFGIRGGVLVGGGTFKGTLALPPRPGEREMNLVEGSVTVVGMEPVPTRRWVHVEFVLDQRGGRLFMDDVQVLSYVEDQESPQDAQDRANGLLGVDPNDPAAAALRQLPETWDPATHMAWIYFGSDGRLDPQHHTQPVEFYMEMPPPGYLDENNYDLWPSVRDLLANSGGSTGFALEHDNPQVKIGGGLFGKIDNAQIAEVESGDAIAMPAGVVLTAQVTNAKDEDGNDLQIERRKITVELMGTIR